MWFVGYTPNLATAAMIAGANSQGQPITLNGQTVGGALHLRAPSAPRVAGPMWGDAMEVVEQYLTTTTSPRPTGDRARRALGDGARASAGMSRRARPRDARGGRLRRQRRRPASTPSYAAGTVAYTSPGSGDVAPQRRHRHDLPLRPARPAAPAEPGGDGGGNGGGGGGNGGGGGGGNGDGNGNGNGDGDG